MNIVIPSNLSLERDIQNYNPKHRFKYLWIIHSILELSQYDTSFEGYVNLHRDLLEKYLHPKYVSTILNQLEFSKIIEINKSYSVGRFSKSYRLCEPYRSAIPVTLNDSFPEKFKKKVKKESLPVVQKHQAMYDNLTRVEIDIQKSMEFIDTLETNSNGEPLTEQGKFWYKRSAQRIAVKDIFLREDRTGRVHHNLTNLPSVLRQFISYEGKSLESTDIANSQVTLFVPLIEEFLRTNRLEHSEDTLLLKELCEKGEFYEYIMQDLGVPIEDRKAFKKEFFAKIFYSKLSQTAFEYKETKRFKQLFPTVYKAIQWYKKDNHADLPIALQKIEAKLVVGLKPECFYFTVHDSVVCLQQDTPYIRELLDQSFKTVNLTPKLKTGEFQ